MSTSAKDRLFSLLFEDGRELVNLKFFPGEDERLTEDRIYDSAVAALQQALDADDVSVPPRSGQAPATLRELLPAV